MWQYFLKNRRKFLFMGLCTNSSVWSLTQGQLLHGQMCDKKSVKNGHNFPGRGVWWWCMQKLLLRPVSCPEVSCCIADHSAVQLPIYRQGPFLRPTNKPFFCHPNLLPTVQIFLLPSKVDATIKIFAHHPNLLSTIKTFRPPSKSSHPKAHCTMTNCKW